MYLSDLRHLPLEIVSVEEYGIRVSSFMSEIIANVNRFEGLDISVSKKVGSRNLQTGVIKLLSLMVIWSKKSHQPSKQRWKGLLIRGRRPT